MLNGEGLKIPPSICSLVGLDLKVEKWNTSIRFLD
jgi:hypothetical protein